jgi:hypothetical protein
MRWAHFKITEPQVVDLKILSNVRNWFHRIYPNHSARRAPVNVNAATTVIATAISNQR